MSGGIIREINSSKGPAKTGKEQIWEKEETREHSFKWEICKSLFALVFWILLDITFEGVLVGSDRQKLGK